jgi:hypothetical protein
METPQTQTQTPTNGTTPKTEDKPKSVTKGELSVDKQTVALAQRAAANTIASLANVRDIEPRDKVKAALKAASRVVFAALQSEIENLKGR